MKTEERKKSKSTLPTLKRTKGKGKSQETKSQETKRKSPQNDDIKTVSTNHELRPFAFGRETKERRILFGDFKDFQWVTGARSVSNIDIHEDRGTTVVFSFRMQNESKQAFILFKMVKTYYIDENNVKKVTDYVDSFLYEYKVGMFLNIVGMQFPCFAETYHLYRFQNEIYQSEMMKCYDFLFSGRKTFDYSSFIHQYKPILDDPAKLVPFSKSQQENFCFDGSLCALTLEYFPEAPTIDRYIKNLDIWQLHGFFKTDLVLCLLQVYGPLCALKDKFTHYDLHSGNVLMTNLIPQQNIESITFHYHYDDYTITFQSPHLVKIIDYGRCFYYQSESNNSAAFFDSLSEDCKKKRSFDTLLRDSVFNVDSRVYSPTRDLVLALYMYTLAKNFEESYPGEFKMPSYLRALQPLYDSIPSTRKFPLKEHCVPPKVITAGRIKSIHDMFSVLKNYAAKHHLIHVDAKSKHEIERQRNIGLRRQRQQAKTKRKQQKQKDEKNPNMFTVALEYVKRKIGILSSSTATESSINVQQKPNVSTRRGRLQIYSDANRRAEYEISDLTPSFS
jgi:hypothetical protein